jgi:RNA-binding protein 5/10
MNKKDRDSQFSFTATGNASIRLAYWDQGAYIRELIVSGMPPAGSVAATEQAPKSTSEINPEGVAPSKDADTKAKKRKAAETTQAANKKVMPSHLQFWKNRHAELHGIEAKPSADSNATEEQQSAHDSTEAAHTTQSYADMNRKCCYLCSRQFKTEAEVNKHERLSDLHRNNLGDENLKAKALAKLAKSGITTKPLPADDTPEYRDRARERRKAYNQPKKPTQTPTKPPVAAAPAEPEEPRQSKGASLLGKMGWSQGQGLGAHGTGMTAPIATEIYAAGVGLGVEGAKMGDAADEAERRTKGGYEGFLEKVKEGARDRWKELGE